jgi:hypothetical protein
MYDALNVAKLLKDAQQMGASGRCKPEGQEAAHDDPALYASHATVGLDMRSKCRQRM